VSYFHDQDDQLAVADLIDCSIFSNPHPIKVFFVHQLLYARRAGVRCKLFDALNDPLLNFPGKFLDLPACKRSELYPASHMAILKNPPPEAVDLGGL
jgi:hypothetical protein